MKVKLRHRRLAEELARRHLTLNGWAQRLGITRGHLSQLVNGKRPYPQPGTRKRLVEGLELSFEDLFEVSVPNEEDRPA